MCWQLTLSISQIVAACINRGVADNETSFAWRFPTAFQLVFPAIVYVAVWFVPESPRWLVSKGRMDKAKRSLERVNTDNKTYDAEEDLNAMQMVIAQEAEDIATGSWSSLFQDPIERRKLLYSVGGIVSGQINGIQWFYYFGTVFAKAIGLEDPFLMTIIVFTIQLFVVGLGVVMTNRIPRRPLMLICTAIMMLSIFIVGCMGINSDGNYVPPVYGKVIITFVIIEIVAANFSWGPLGWTIVR
jgi:SP family sugar:H+ symporter-like MFS transporter